MRYRAADYLKKNRYGVFYYRRVIPPHLRRFFALREVARSTGRLDRREAVVLARRYNVGLELLRGIARRRVDGTVQQLAVHTVGGVVTPAQVLMAIAPTDYQAEIEAFLENQDVGFVKVGQRAEVKIDTVPFTRYGTLSGMVAFVSKDAVPDEKRGLIYQARVKLDSARIWVDERYVTLTPGMAVTTEIATTKRRVIDFFLDPIRKTTSQALRER